MNRVTETIGRWLASYLEQPVRAYTPFSVAEPEQLARTLKPADVLLVEGNQRISVAIKYLTQSTWSHSALYVGDALDPGDGSRRAMLIEADLGNGVTAVPLDRYAGFNVRICRPVRLSRAHAREVVEFAIARLGHRYDLKNVIDLMRYLLPQPPVPSRWRRRLLALGSGDPTRAICSTLIAQAFQSVYYPILPEVTAACLPGRFGRYREQEILHIRHHSLFAPRDFDLSPYFRIVKPTLEQGFNYRKLVWADSVAPPVEPEIEMATEE